MILLAAVDSPFNRCYALIKLAGIRTSTSTYFFQRSSCLRGAFSMRWVRRYRSLCLNRSKKVSIIFSLINNFVIFIKLLLLLFFSLLVVLSLLLIYNVPPAAVAVAAAVVFAVFVAVIHIGISKFLDLCSFFLSHLGLKRYTYM